MEFSYPMILDGGLSNELERQGCDLNHQLWSAHMLDKNPDAISLAHLSYLNAGAQCILTASYQATYAGFLALGHTKDQASELIFKSVDCAEKARFQFMESNPTAPRPLIAASIGPYGAYLADGSEYRGDYNISDQELMDFHEARVYLLANSIADILACETIPSLQEAKVLSKILVNVNKPAWVSFSCIDGQHICDGTPIADCASLFAHHPTVFCIGVNCTPPKYISELIQSIKTKSRDKKIVVYPNSGAVYNADSKSWSGLIDPSTSGYMVKEWIDLGANIVGGCCGIGPQQISSMARVIS